MRNIEKEPLFVLSKEQKEEFVKIYIEYLNTINKDWYKYSYIKVKAAGNHPEYILNVQSKRNIYFKEIPFTISFSEFDVEIKGYDRSDYVDVIRSTAIPHEEILALYYGFMNKIFGNDYSNLLIKKLDSEKELALKEEEIRHKNAINDITQEHLNRARLILNATKKNETSNNI